MCSVFFQLSSCSITLEHGAGGVGGAAGIGGVAGVGRDSDFCLTDDLSLFTPLYFSGRTEVKYTSVYI